ADVRIQHFFLDGANPGPAVFHALLERLRAGPASSAELFVHVPTRNPMSVDTALGTLRREGAIVRDVDPATGEDRYALPVAQSAFKLGLDALRAKREGDERRLHAICAYAAGSACRRAYVLRYFGSHEARERCEACDRCMGLTHFEARDLDDEERRVVR